MKLFLGFICLLCLNSYAENIRYEQVKREYENILTKDYVLMPHKGTYILPISYNNNPNHSVFEPIEQEVGDESRGRFTRYLETEFQVSFLILTNKKIFGSNFDTFLGYTHTAYWQLYNEDWSRPFRETNYTPEFFARYIYDKPKDFLGLKLVAYDFGLVHQSNGQIQELSRSWNRAFTRVAFLSGSTVFNLSLWYRFPEKREDDDNPYMYRYLGYGEIDINHKFKEDDLNFKIIPGSKYISGEISYSTPWKEGLRFYAKASYGRGLSLQDYNHENRRIGLGLILANPFVTKD